MLEHLWVCLGLVGLCSPRSWWVALLLSGMGAVQIWAFYMLPEWGYTLAAPLIEFGAAVAIARFAVRDGWSVVTAWLFFASFTVQAGGAFFGAFGLPVDRFLYLALNAIFTAQLACVAYPGGQCLARSILRLGDRSGRGGSDVAEYSAQGRW